MKEEHLAVLGEGDVLQSLEITVGSFFDSFPIPNHPQTRAHLRTTGATSLALINIPILDLDPPS